MFIIIATASLIVCDVGLVYYTVNPLKQINRGLVIKEEFFADFVGSDTNQTHVNLLFETNDYTEISIIAQKNLCSFNLTEGKTYRIYIEKEWITPIYESKLLNITITEEPTFSATPNDFIQKWGAYLK